MRQIICDRCGEVISRTDTTGYVNLNRQDIRSGEIVIVGDGNPFENWDLCDKCMDEIEQFIANKPAWADAPPTVKKPTATIKRPIAADTKWAALTPEKIEQIKQMVRDGKTVKEIVDATGVSDPTVRKYKREVDNKKAEPFTEGPAED